MFLKTQFMKIHEKTYSKSIIGRKVGADSREYQPVISERMMSTMKQVFFVSQFFGFFETRKC